jgi:2'-5' RNA ligase
MQGVFEFCRTARARPARPERLFFGLLPDAVTAGRLRRFREQFVCDRRLDGTWIEAERLHVSLHHVGDFRRLRDKVIYAAQQAGNAVAVPAFEMTFRFIGSFEGRPSMEGRTRRRPLVLLGEGESLADLHKGLGTAMVKGGLRANPYFAPHMTLFYGIEPVPIQAIRPIRAVVDAFVLIHSELGHARHNIVARWPLKGGLPAVQGLCEASRRDRIQADGPGIAGSVGTGPQSAGW